MDIATCELMATKIMGWQNAKNNHWNNHKMVMVMMKNMVMDNGTNHKENGNGNNLRW